MSWIKDFFNHINEESEEEKQNRIDKENSVVKQNELLKNLICPICGNHEFNKSLVIASGAEYNSFVQEVVSYYRPDDKPFYNKTYKINSIICLHCGYIMSFVDMSTMKIQKL